MLTTSQWCHSLKVGSDLDGASGSNFKNYSYASMIHVYNSHLITCHAEGIMSSLFNIPSNLNWLVLNLSWCQLITSIHTDTTVKVNLHTQLQIEDKHHVLKTKSNKIYWFTWILAVGATSMTSGTTPWTSIVGLIVVFCFNAIPVCNIRHRKRSLAGMVTSCPWSYLSSVLFKSKNELCFI